MEGGKANVKWVGQGNLDLTLFRLCKCEWDTSPVTSNNICQAAPVFPVVVNNRIVLSLQLSQGWVYFLLKFRQGSCIYRKQKQVKPLSVYLHIPKTETGEAIECVLAYTENRNRWSHWVFTCIYRKQKQVKPLSVYLHIPKTETG